MKKAVGKSIVAIALMLIASCATPEKKAELSETEGVTAIVENTSQPLEATKPVDTTSIFGAYVGDFVAEKYREDKNITYSNLISIFLDSMSGDQLFGHSVVAGNNASFVGQYESVGNGRYRAEVKEPGTNKYDGIFRLELDSATDEVKGNWIAYDTTLDVSERSFLLKKRSFKYDPSLTLNEDFTNIPISEIVEASEEGEGGKAELVTEDAIKHNASIKLLETKDVENMKRGDLEVLRNTIYARHGYTFRNRYMRALFDYVPWYMPVSTDIRDQLTEIERKNIALLKRYEEHAERYYDYFGR
jgi:hypothetical protein